MGQQRQVLDFARALATTRAHGVEGRSLLSFAATIETGELKAMADSIAKECE